MKEMASTLSTQIHSLQRVGVDCTETLAREGFEIADKMRNESIDSIKVQERDIIIVAESAKHDMNLVAESATSTYKSTLTTNSLRKVVDFERIIERKLTNANRTPISRNSEACKESL